MPVHSVELGHMVLLNVNVQDTGKLFLHTCQQSYSNRVVFKPSDFAIINADSSADFDIENKIVLRDPKDRKLDLRLHYVSVLSSDTRTYTNLSTVVSRTLVEHSKFKFIAPTSS